MPSEVTHAQLAQQLGAVQATQVTHGADIDELKTDVKAIRSMMDQGKGAWKVVLAVVGVSSAVGAGIATFVSRYGGILPH
jgi:hypothetical protein